MIQNKFFSTAFLFLLISIGYTYPMVDTVYHTNIKSILLHQSIDNSTGTPIIKIEQQAPLLLQFDDLNNNAENYYFKLIHCNADWQPSILSTNQYLYDFNEFRVTDRDMSFNARIQYFHFSTTIPKVKVSGNYLLVVYKDYDDTNIAFTKRFIVYEPSCNVAFNITRASDPRYAYTNQQVNFSVMYGNLNVANIYKDIKVVVRQNFRWDKTISNLKPVFIKDFEKTLDYDFYNNENAFKGLNEFRFFDARSVLFNGMYIDRIQRTNSYCDVWIMEEKTRYKMAYTFYDDINGSYYPQVYESQNRTLEPDYIYTHFSLKADQPYDGDVYLQGQLNQWLLMDDYKMKYDPIEKRYTLDVWLKQGYYNYMYSVVKNGIKDESIIEGNSSLTENAYDIIVYARLQGEQYDRIVGYNTMRYRGR